MAIPELRPTDQSLTPLIIFFSLAHARGEKCEKGLPHYVVFPSIESVNRSMFLIDVFDRVSFFH